MLYLDAVSFSHFTRDFVSLFLFTMHFRFTPFEISLRLSIFAARMHLYDRFLTRASRS